MLRRQRHLPISRISTRLAAPVGLGPAARVRRGLTLIEMMVAVVMLSIGLLGLASTSGYVVRQVGGGAKQSTVAQAIANRIDKLRSLGCDQIQSGSNTARGVSESWTRGAIVNRVLSVGYTVSYRVAGEGLKTQTLTITVPCG
jgi:prepilin-type N-terminal cleavage/methylation domain-containing protein